MAKKEIKLGLKPMMNLIESDQMGKISAMARERKFDIEAVKYLLNSDKIDHYVFEELQEGYEFKELFENFEDYICSNVARRIYDDGEACVSFGWLRDMPSSSEELIALFEKHKGKELVIFKHFFYKQRRTALTLELKDKYTACLKGIFEIYKRVHKDHFIDEMHTFSQIFIWAQYISRDFIDFAEAECGESAVKGWLLERVSNRQNYIRKEGAEDLFETYEYLIEKGARPEGILHIINPMSWEINSSMEVEHYKRCQRLYDRFIAPEVKEDPLNIYNRFGYHRHEEYNHLLFMLYSKDEEQINKAFNNSNRKYGITDAISSIIHAQYCHKDLEFQVTGYVAAASRLIARTIRNVIVDHPITNADELLKLKEEIEPFSNTIEPFGNNPFITNNLNFGEFSKEDVDKISFYLRWNQISRYFKDEKIPYNFLMEHKNKIQSFETMNYSTLDRFTASQKVEFFREFGDKVGAYAKTHLISKILCKEKDFTPAEVAELLKQIEHIVFYKSEECETKLNIQSILTLL